MFGAVAARQIKLVNPSADSPGAVMILAMDIVSNSPTQRDKLCSGRNGQEIAGRDDKLQNFSEANAGLGDEQSICPIKADEMVKTGHVNHRAAIIDAAISV